MVKRLTAPIGVLIYSTLVLPAFAETRQDAKLFVSVVDSTGAVLQAATVTVACEDDVLQPGTTTRERTSDRGVAVFEGLRPAACTVEGAYAGLETTRRDVRVKGGDNTLVLVLAPKPVVETVAVAADPRAAAAERTALFGSVLTRDEIDALSNDPNDMRRQLAEMAGPDAIIRVDGFEGAPLPPKAQIKSIRIQRDQFAAENHSAGATFIDIVTQVGVGPLRFSFTGPGFQNSALDGRDPLIPTKTPSRAENYGLNLSDTLVHDRASFSLSMSGLTALTQPNVYAASLSGQTVAEVVDVQVPTRTAAVSSLFDYAITRDQTLGVGYTQEATNGRNLGVGGFNLPDRAYADDSDTYNLRVREEGPLGRRFFMTTRLSFTGTRSSLQSAVEAQTIQVIDAFTSGGAQVAGGARTRTLDVQSDLDYVRGRHSIRVGVQLSGAWSRSTAQTNYLGTYTFVSLAAFNAGAPALFTQRVGNPLIDDDFATAGVYAQDDMRLRTNLTLSAGVRYELQNHIRDDNNVGPRVGLTWAPFRGGRTTLRASAGVFYDWVSASIYQQTQLINGEQQQELEVIDPVFTPGQVPIGAGAVAPANTYGLAPNLQLERSERLSTSVSQLVTSRISVAAIYTRLRIVNQLSGVDLNAAMDPGGTRPDPTRGDVIAAGSDAMTRASALSSTVTANFGPMSAASDAMPVDWRRGSVMAAYYLSKTDTNALGAFVVSPTGTLASEWGPANDDVRQRVSVYATSSAVKNLNVTLSLSAATGMPYTETTGADSNGEFMFNERPPGVGRNSLRTPGQWTLNAYVGYTVAFARRAAGGRSSAVSPSDTFSTRGLQVTFSLVAANLTNHANYIGFSGVQASPFFMRPTTVANPRVVTLNAGISF